MSSTDLLLVGINHLTAPISCREGIAIPQERLQETLTHLKRQFDLQEVVLLSTCSRTEVYTVVQRDGAVRADIYNWFLERAGSQVSDKVYIKEGEEAVSHIFRVAAGLDSWIIGESEILGQVKRAYQTALDQQMTGRFLNQIFQKAVGTGKMIRAKTGIQNGIHSIGGAAALLAKRIFSDAVPSEVIVFGAGEAAQTVVKHLSAKNFNKIYVANRTLKHAQDLADALEAEAVAMERGIELLERVQIAVFSTASPRVLLEAKTLERILRRRRQALFLIDLGLPRNVDPLCLRFAQVYLYDLDDLREIVRKSITSKADAKEKAEVLAAQASAECIVRLEASEAKRGDRAVTVL